MNCDFQDPMRRLRAPFLAQLPCSSSGSAKPRNAVQPIAMRQLRAEGH